MADSDQFTAAVRQRVETLVRKEVQALHGYQVAHAQGLIKLDAMENPFPWPAEIKQQWQAQLEHAEPNRYPDPAAGELKAQLRQALAIAPETELLLGNGSDELIQLLILALAGPGKTVMAPQPSFVMYRLLTEATGGTFVGVPLRAQDFSLDIDAMLEAMERHQPTLVFLACPNNPTGNLFARQDILRIIERACGAVVVDEAYEPFVHSSVIAQLQHHANLLVMRTLSKLGLAGLRLGYLAAAPGWINELDKLRLPYNINVLTQISVTFALRHYAVWEQQCQQMLVGREFLYGELKKMNSLHVWPSEANFLLCKVLNGDAPGLVESLKRQGLLIRLLHGSDPLLKDCVRISVGTPDQNQQLLAAIGYNQR